MNTFYALAVAVPAWFCAAAFAQTPPDALPQPTPLLLLPPLSQQLQLPQLHYRSVFTDYQAFNDQPVAPWQTTNDTVAKTGGWRAYAKEAAQPDANPAHGSHGAKP